MTRRSSPRAQVRALFREMSEEGAVEGMSRTKPEAMTMDGRARDAHIGGAESSDSAARRHTNASVFTSAQATEATERARALYEDTAVPVREIARRCGVTERTILKYAAKLDWKPRYHWIGGAAGERHRRWQPVEKFAPVKGAGARFVRREAVGQPFAAGLKALDPQAEAQATAACDAALALARAAEARAEQARHDERIIAALGLVDDLLMEIGAWRRARERAREHADRAAFRAANNLRGCVWRDGIMYDARHLAINEWHERRREQTALPPDRFEDTMWRLVAAALGRWERLLENGGMISVPRGRPGGRQTSQTVTG